MKTKQLIFTVFVFSINVISLFRSTVARGSEQSNTSEEAVQSLRRSLVEDHFQKLERLARGYMTNSDLENAINAFNYRCSHISRIYSIGKSVLGIQLWVIEISDKPGEEEAEPAFKFIGNVHGDEPVGRELLLFLANWLCDNYKKNPLATLIVKNVHLHILPSMNPDGFALRSRGNMNNIDLNRDFPDQFFTMNNDLDERQPETKAVMSWSKQIHFTASASLHGGALVANYPWDGTQNKETKYYACPDDKTFRFMASVYSHSHYNMSLSKEFVGGITNGASWYPIYGGMQDWNYIHGGCFELTLEISDDKWPNAKELPTLWEFNKMSMLNLVASLVKTGVHGRVFSSDCGGLLPASIAIRGINHTINANSAFADYHRLLAPDGKYEVVATLSGYKSKSTSILLEQDAMTVDFILDPEITSGRCLLPLLPTGCNNKNAFKLAELLPGFHLEIFIILVLILVFLCFLMKRKVILNSNQARQRQTVGLKRTDVV